MNYYLYGLKWAEVKVDAALKIKLALYECIYRIPCTVRHSWFCYWFTLYINKQQLNEININNHLRQQINTSPQ